MMKPAELAILVNTLSVAIGKFDFTSDELALLGAIFVQIGDTLAAMALQMDMNNK